MTTTELDELLTLLRRHGVTSYSDDVHTVQLGPPPPDPKKRVQKEESPREALHRQRMEELGVL